MRILRLRQIGGSPATNGIALVDHRPLGGLRSVGYWLDPTNTEFRRTQVSRPLGQAIDWCVAIVPVADRAEDNQRWVDVTREPPLKREQHAAV